MNNRCLTRYSLLWPLLALLPSMLVAGGLNFGGGFSTSGQFRGDQSAQGEHNRYSGAYPGWQGVDGYPAQPPLGQGYKFRDLPSAAGSERRSPVFRPDPRGGRNAYQTGGSYLGRQWAEDSVRLAPVFRPLDDKKTERKRPEQAVERYRYNPGYRPDLYPYNYPGSGAAPRW